MRKIEALERIERKEVMFAEAGVNATLYWAYRNSKKSGNTIINFDDTVWEQDVPQIVENCRMLGIKKFAISSHQSSLLETIWAFELEGCKLQKLTKVRARYHNLLTGEENTAIAAVIKINPKECTK